MTKKCLGVLCNDEQEVQHIGRRIRAMPTALDRQPPSIQSPGIVTMTKHIEGNSKKGKRFFAQIEKAPDVVGKSNDPLLQTLVQALLNIIPITMMLESIKLGTATRWTAPRIIGAPKSGPKIAVVFGAWLALEIAVEEGEMRRFGGLFHDCMEQAGLLMRLEKLGNDSTQGRKIGGHHRPYRWARGRIFSLVMMVIK